VLSISLSLSAAAFSSPPFSPPVIAAYGARRNELVMPVGMWVYPILGFIQSNKANTERAQDDLKRALAVLQAHLANSTYLVGGAVTLADIVVCCSLLNAFKLVMDAAFLAPYKAVVRWFTTCATAQSELPAPPLARTPARAPCASSSPNPSPSSLRLL